MKGALSHARQTDIFFLAAAVFSIKQLSVFYFHYVTPLVDLKLVSKVTVLSLSPSI